MGPLLGSICLMFHIHPANKSIHFFVSNESVHLLAVTSRSFCSVERRSCLFITVHPVFSPASISVVRRLGSRSSHSSFLADAWSGTTSCLVQGRGVTLGGCVHAAVLSSAISLRYRPAKVQARPRCSFCPFDPHDYRNVPATVLENEKVKSGLCVFFC